MKTQTQQPHTIIFWRPLYLNNNAEPKHGIILHLLSLSHNIFISFTQLLFGLYFIIVCNSSPLFFEYFNSCSYFKNRNSDQFLCKVIINFNGSYHYSFGLVEQKWTCCFSLRSYHERKKIYNKNKINCNSYIT